MKYLSFSILIASSFAALASAVSEDVEISQRHRNLDNDEPFKLLFQSTHERFTPEKEWCLTAKRDGIGSLIHVRECKQFDEDETNLQLWERYDHNQLKLSDSSRNLCLRARHRRIYLHTCQQKTDYRNSFIVDESNNYIEHDNDDGIQFLLGLRRSNVMGRVLLMQANTRSILDNDTLTWNVRYVSQTSAPTPSPTSSPVQGGGGRTIPVPSPVESPTMCEDDPDFEFEIVNTSTGIRRTRNCAWLTSEPQRAQIRIERFCIAQVIENCKQTCDTC
ncbi:predicted protein [Chaetoceros tenuissimus]|uniref:Ricin B lectin domain-containing protein n=1 Tax=Chaetoceros tenuissimus TaxID=426638 RepID=A0AAD3H0M5_9STRA|nr:predicted protein [Chaetoceros tenuissimus]